MQFNAGRSTKKQGSISGQPATSTTKSKGDAIATCNKMNAGLCFTSSHGSHIYWRTFKQLVKVEYRTSGYRAVIHIGRHKGQEDNDAYYHQKNSS